MATTKQIDGEVAVLRRKCVASIEEHFARVERAGRKSVSVAVLFGSSGYFHEAKTLSRDEDGAVVLGTIRYEIGPNWRASARTLRDERPDFIMLRALPLNVLQELLCALENER